MTQGGEKFGDAANYTNRSLFTMRHIIREVSLERVITDYPDVYQIPVQNIALMNRLGQDKLQAILKSCYHNNAG